MGYPRDPKLKGLAAVTYHSEHLSWGTSHINVDGKTGLVVEPASPAALGEAMARLHQDPELAPTLDGRPLRLHLRFAGRHQRNVKRGHGCLGVRLGASARLD